MSKAKSTTNAKPEPTALDPFAPENLRLSQDFTSTIGVKKVLTKVPCRKPNRQEFVRVRVGEDWRVDTCVFEDVIDRETYLVASEFVPELLEEIKPVCLRLTTNKQGDLFLWPLKLPGADGRTNHWHESAIEAAKCAENKWVRVSANMPAGMYDVYEATGDLVEPQWTEHSFRDLLELAFKANRIDAHDHPMLRKFRGEV